MKKGYSAGRALWITPHRDPIQIYHYADKMSSGNRPHLGGVTKSHPRGEAGWNTSGVPACRLASRRSRGQGRGPARMEAGHSPEVGKG